MTTPSFRPRPNPVGVPPSLRRWYDRGFTWGQAARPARRTGFPRSETV
ncbi:hypothetical protein [Amaricoccus sp.]|nr:hypothetical protein [Amaricoccus sp.]HRO11461.1 hypothetical protein [Amaricoccus sp.]